MSDILEPCPFCGSEVDFFIRDNFGDDYKSLIIDCKECFASMELLIYAYASAEDFEKRKKEMFEAWNRRVKRTAKVIEHDASITDTDGNKYQRSEYLCGNCKKKVLGGDEYCSHCGSRLIWDEDIPMEYFESGGI